MTRLHSILLTLVAVSLTAGGCRYMGDDEGLFVDARDDYLDARAAAPLRVPQDLSAAHVADSWPIPDVQGPVAAQVFPKQAPRPEVLVGNDIDAVRIQKLGDRSWIVLPDSPAKAWPQVKQFFAENGVGIIREDPDRGAIESEWMVVEERDYGDVVRTALRDGRRQHAEAGNSLSPGRDQLLLLVERGIRRGSTEVHITHRRADGVEDAISPPVPEVEKEFTAKLAEYFASGVAVSVSMVGRDVATESKATVVKNASGYPFLRLRVSFERAWATVTQALERAEIEVQEADMEQAVCWIRYAGAGGRRGWLQRIVPGGGAEDDDGSLAIRLEREDDRTVLIRVERADGTPTNANLAQEILVTVRQFAA